MNYFSRRNEYIVEYSGHEEASGNLRSRLLAVVGKYVDYNSTIPVEGPWSVDIDDFNLKVQQEFPNRDPFEIIKSGAFHELFTVIEIFLDMARNIYYSRRNEVPGEVLNAFKLSGSVYTIDSDLRISLKIDEDLSKKISSIQPLLSPYPEFSQRFFQAVGNLLGRRAKPEDVVKDIFVAAEGYLKAITGTNHFGDAIKYLSKDKLINKEQKKVLEALHEFRSDADGAGHAGNSETPTEETALWFLDTLISQLRMIEKKKIELKK